MANDLHLRRRRLLQGAGVGGATMLAGCLGSSNDDGENGENGDGPEPDQIDFPDGDEREVGYVVSPTPEDEERLQEISQEMQQLQFQPPEDYDEDDIEEELEELQEEQEEIIQDTIDVATATVTDQTDATVDEEIAEMGGIRVTGVPQELVDLLLADSIDMLVSTDALEVPQQPAP